MSPILIEFCFFYPFFSSIAKNECPLSSQATTCSPKCVSDNDCLSSGKRCCSNICNTKSCVFPKSGASGGGDKNKGFLGFFLLKLTFFNTFEHFQLVQLEHIAEIVNAVLEKSAKWIRVQRDNSVDVLKLRSLLCFNGFVFFDFHFPRTLVTLKRWF